ncbi:MAG: HD domain-containing protein [Chloroflexi bacterium]|nr:HD domain-containing protein [Chloroflexota bacterium]
MKNQYVTDFQAGDDLLDELLLLKDMVRRTTKDNRPYILCTLADKTGQVAGVFWDVPTAVDNWIKAGQVLFITGKVSRYKDSLQVGITDAYPQPNPDMGEFMATGARSTAEMVAELRVLIDGLGEPYGRLTRTILLEEKFLAQFSNAPAAKNMHHAYIGGLLDHSLSMARLGAHMASHYPKVNQDLLVAGALLHDMGKVYEYAFDGSFEFSDDGRLVGHIVRAAVIVEQTAAKLGDIPPRVVQDIVHLILSHHGNLEWGAPVVPKTLEAVILHQLDLLDSRVQGFYDHVNNDNSEGEWTSKESPMHRTYLRKG